MTDGKRRHRTRAQGDNNTDCVSAEGGPSSSSSRFDAEKPYDAAGSENQSKKPYEALRMENAFLSEYYKTLLSKEDYEAAFTAFRTPLPAALRITKSAPMWRATAATIHELSLALKGDNNGNINNSRNNQSHDGSGKGGSNAATAAAAAIATTSNTQVTCSNSDAPCTESSNNIPIGTSSCQPEELDAVSYNQSDEIVNSIKGNEEDYSGFVIPWYPEGLAWQWNNLNRVTIKKDKRYEKLKQFLVAEGFRGAVVRQVRQPKVCVLDIDTVCWH